MGAPTCNKALASSEWSATPISPPQELRSKVSKHLGCLLYRAFKAYRINLAVNTPGVHLGSPFRALLRVTDQSNEEQVMLMCILL